LEDDGQGARKRGKAINIDIGADKIGEGAHCYDFDVNEEALKKAVILLSTLAFEVQNTGGCCFLIN